MITSPLRQDDVLDFCACNLTPITVNTNSDVAITKPRQENLISKAKQNAAHHYDLNLDLFKLFLDKDLQYSCAYFANSQDNLEKAQENKKKLITAKLLLEPGMRVLDIGSGWGGLALHLAKEADVDVSDSLSRTTEGR